MENPEIEDNLVKIFNSKNLDDDFIKNNLSISTNEEFIESVSKNISNKNNSKEQIIKKVKKTINNENTEDKRKISKIKAQTLTSNLLDYFDIKLDKEILKSSTKLKELCENQEKFDTLFTTHLISDKRIVIILDNFSVHKTYLSRIICKILNIKLIPLPKYSPHLNPIEQSWRDIKNIIYRKPIIDIKTLTKDFIEQFEKNIDKPSLTKNWINKFIAKK